MNAYLYNSNMNDMSNKEIYYTLPISVLRNLAPLLTECFGYRKEMFTNELLQAFNKHYPNREDAIPNREKYMVDFPQLDEYAIDEGVFDHKRYAPRKPSSAKRFDITSYMLDSNHDITFASKNEHLPQQIIKLLAKYNEEDKQDVICDTLFTVAIIYEKYQSGELYTDITWSEDMLPYVTKVRPEMLKLYEFLSSGIMYKDKTPKPIILDNGKQKVTLDNSYFWLTDLLGEYLHIYLGVDSLEEAQKELKDIYAPKKGRQAANPAFNLIMFGTYQLLKSYSSLKTRTEQVRLVLGYLNLLGFFDEDDSKNDENNIQASIANLEKQGYKPKWKPKQLEDYSLSPNNPTTNHFW